MNINDVRGLLIVVAGVLIIVAIVMVLFWKDNRKGVRLFKRAKKSTIAALVSQCKEMSQNAGNDSGEIYLGDYILKGNANASLKSKGARKHTQACCDGNQVKGQYKDRASVLYDFAFTL